MNRLFLGLFLLLTTTSYAQLEEPLFCKPSEILKYEIPVQRLGGKLKRARAFKINGVTLVGVGVGESDHVGLQRLYHAEATPGASAAKYCTWYFNKGNKSAQRVFNHHPMSKPSSNADKAAREWLVKLGPIFGSDNFESCLNKDKYVAFGCHGQKHRGPTAFGMMLSYLGCSPENAEKITRNLWGLNGIKAASRVAINKEGKQIGDALRRRVAGQTTQAGQQTFENLNENSSGEDPMGPLATTTLNSPFFSLNATDPTTTSTTTAAAAAPKPKPPPRAPANRDVEEETQPAAQTSVRPQNRGYGDSGPSGYGGDQQQGY